MEKWKQFELWNSQATCIILLVVLFLFLLLLRVATIEYLLLVGPFAEYSTVIILFNPQTTKNSHLTDKETEVHQSGMPRKGSFKILVSLNFWNICSFKQFKQY